MVVALAGPTPMWYATRASGYTALILLSLAVVLGLITSLRESRRAWPRFVVQSLHRNISLLVVVFLVLHILTSIIDPFAKLTFIDAVVPFVATYRPLWLGLGVVSFELLAAITATSLLRHRVGWRTWRAIHLLAYVSWPVAVVHGVATGTDTKSWWALLLVTLCVVVVFGALTWRLARAGPGMVVLRATGAVVGVAALGLLAIWMADRPTPSRLGEGGRDSRGSAGGHGGRACHSGAGAPPARTERSAQRKPGAVVDDGDRDDDRRSRPHARGAGHRERRRVRRRPRVPVRRHPLQRRSDYRQRVRHCAVRVGGGHRPARQRDRQVARRNAAHAAREPMSAPEVLEGTSRRLLPERPIPEDLAAHLTAFGPRARLDPDAMLAALDESGLRGRGGADFPTGVKWRAVRESSSHPHDRVVVANAAECEPASWKDRTLLAMRPHLVLDGLEHAAETTGARRAVVYTTRSHTDVQDALGAAIAERRRQSESDLFIEVQIGPNRYVSGEETAVISRISGHLAKPKVVPPRPFQRGVNGLPTLVQNVETLAHAALIARHGASWFHTVGTRRSPGTALLTVSGAVGAPRVVEATCDTSVRDIVASAGGATGEPAAVLVGGYFGRWVAADRIWNQAIDAESLRAIGTSLGTGVLIVLPATVCGVAETDRILTFLATQTAQQCGPCHVGLPAIAEQFHNVATGRARPSALDTLTRWSTEMLGRGACRHPDGAVLFLASALEVFAADLRHHSRAGGCRFSGSPALLSVPNTEAGWW